MLGCSAASRNAPTVALMNRIVPEATGGSLDGTQ
jgi:hypothetical protein